MRSSRLRLMPRTMIPAFVGASLAAGGGAWAADAGIAGRSDAAPESLLRMSAPAIGDRGLEPLPLAKPLPAGAILLAAGCNPCNPCAAGACNPCNPCSPCAAGGASAASECVVPRLKAAAACNPCNPCAAANPCAAGGCNPCNPCAAKNPYAGANPCAAGCDPCNPCNPCNPCAPSGDEVELSPEEAQAAYDCLLPGLKEGFAKSGLAVARDYDSWDRVSTAPYVSATHGGRFVNNYANDVASPSYRKFEQVGTMPAGSILAKDSFAVKPDGTTQPGPLFLMEKAKAGTSPDTGDWIYSMVMPNGAIYGTTKGEGDAKVQFCAECHGIAEDQDSLFFMPQEYRPK